MKVALCHLQPLKTSSTLKSQSSFNDKNQRPDQNRPVIREIRSFLPIIITAACMRLMSLDLNWQDTVPHFNPDYITPQGPFIVSDIYILARCWNFVSHNIAVWQLGWICVVWSQHYSGSSSSSQRCWMEFRSELYVHYAQRHEAGLCANRNRKRPSPNCCHQVWNTLLSRILLYAVEITFPFTGSVWARPKKHLHSKGLHGSSQGPIMLSRSLDCASICLIAEWISLLLSVWISHILDWDQLSLSKINSCMVGLDRSTTGVMTPTPAHWHKSMLPGVHILWAFECLIFMVGSTWC